jgi:c-di-AMP phosphodiesterase-like protein
MLTGKGISQSLQDQITRFTSRVIALLEDSPDMTAAGASIGFVG